MSSKHPLTARLKAARKAAGYKTAKAFIEASGIPASTYSQHETGRREPQDEALKLYSKLFKVRFEWLKHGHGSPYSKANKNLNQQKKVLTGEMLDLSEESDNLINETLLAEILKRLLKLSETRELAPNQLAEAAANIYSDIFKLETDPTLQIKMINPAISAFVRYALK